MKAFTYPGPTNICEKNFSGVDYINWYMEAPLISSVQIQNLSQLLLDAPQPGPGVEKTALVETPFTERPLLWSNLSSFQKRLSGERKY